MRLAILADVHGNVAALEAVIADLEQRDVDAVWVGGDLVGRGPEGRAVVERIRGLGWPTLAGNHEEYLLDFHHGRTPAEWQGLEEWDASRWMAAEIDGESYRYLEALPFSLDHQGLRLVHGTPKSNRHGIAPWTRDDEIVGHLASVEESLLVCAHTHRPLDRTFAEGRVVNIGSVGMPFDRDPRARYGIFSRSEDTWDFESIRVEYDRQAIFRAYERTGFLAAGGVTARLLRLELEHATPILVPFIEWARHLGKAPTTALLDDFFAVFDPERPLREFIDRMRDGVAPAGR